MSYYPLHTEADFEAAREASFQHPVVLFKHSLTCPISAAAQSALNQLGNAGDPPVYRLVVQQARVLSRAIAETFNVRHESPQALLLVNGAVAAHTSHYRVTADWVRSQLEAA